MQRFPHLALALLLPLSLSSLVFESASAASPVPPGHVETHPIVMQQAAIAVANAKVGTLKPFQAPALRMPAVGGSGSLQREVFGFGLASSLNDPTIGYTSWDFSLLTTVAFFGLHINDDGSMASDSGMSVWNSSILNGLLTTAHAHATKVVLTIVLQDFASGTPHMCAGLINRVTTVSQTVAQVAAKGVDGVNVDYEGLNGTCSNGVSARAMMNDFVARLRAALPGGSYLSVDTYASSATDPIGFFDIGGLNNYVDSFFVMAYDLEYSNYAHPPLSCSGFCLGPTAPLAGYYYNDTNTAAEYAATVPSNKVILGVPYYGRKACVSALGPNSSPTGAVTADGYLDASTEAVDPQVLANSYSAHRDANDPAGQERWDLWWNTTLSCARELYWDDVASISQKYDLVRRDNLRGVGIWTLNYGGGSPELWSAINTYFACPVAMTLAATQTTTEFGVPLTVGNCSATSIDVQQYDSTQNHGWYPLTSVPLTKGAGTAVIEGHRGYTYQIRARAHSAAGFTGEWAMGTTTVSSVAGWSHPFMGLYTLDGYGGISADASPPDVTAAYWPGWKIARAAKAFPTLSSEAGLVLDGYGGLHWFGIPVAVTSPAYWPGWDIARDLAILPDGSGGYVLDGYGGLHPFSTGTNAMPPAAVGGPSWPGWDIARKVVIFSDGSGGLVLDGYGGLHPFGIGRPAPAATTGGPYWPAWPIARDVVLVPGTHGGYVLDGYGGLHPFSGASPLNTPAYWPGWDIARSVLLLAGSTLTAPAGYLMDGYGGPHPFGGAPALTTFPYSPGQDLAVSLLGS
jgi:spore germination protein YaaH